MCWVKASWSWLIKVWKLLFFACLSKTSESPRYSLLVFVFCCQGFVGSTGISFSTHALSSQAHFWKSKIHLHMPHSPLKINTMRGIKSEQIYCCHYANEKPMSGIFSWIYCIGSDTLLLIPNGYLASLDTIKNRHTYFCVIRFLTLPPTHTYLAGVKEVLQCEVFVATNDPLVPNCHWQTLPATDIIIIIILPPSLPQTSSSFSHPPCHRHHHHHHSPTIPATDIIIILILPPSLPQTSSSSSFFHHHCHRHHHPFHHRHYHKHHHLSFPHNHCHRHHHSFPHNHCHRHHHLSFPTITATPSPLPSCQTSPSSSLLLFCYACVCVCVCVWGGVVAVRMCASCVCVCVCVWGGVVTVCESASCVCVLMLLCTLATE